MLKKIKLVITKILILWKNNTFLIISQKQVNEYHYKITYVILQVNNLTGIRYSPVSQEMYPYLELQVTMTPSSFQELSPSETKIADWDTEAGLQPRPGLVVTPEKRFFRIGFAFVSYINALFHSSINFSFKMPLKPLMSFFNHKWFNAALQVPILSNLSISMNPPSPYPASLTICSTYLSLSNQHSFSHPSSLVLCKQSCVM